MSMTSDDVQMAGNLREPLPRRFRISIQVALMKLALTTILFLCVARIFGCTKKRSCQWPTLWQSCLVTYARQKYASILLMSMQDGRCMTYLETADTPILRLSRWVTMYFKKTSKRLKRNCDGRSNLQAR